MSRNRSTLLYALLLTIWALVLFALTAQAQTPVSAKSGIIFVASPDHNGTNPSGSPIVDHYELVTITQSGGALVFTRQLGKPTPAPNNEITVVPISEFGSLAYGVVHTATVAAVGPGGSGVSAPSAPFVRPTPPDQVPTVPTGLRVVP